MRPTEKSYDLYGGKGCHMSHTRGPHSSGQCYTFKSRLSGMCRCKRACVLRSQWGTRVAHSSQIRSTDAVLLTRQPAGPRTQLLQVFPTHLWSICHECGRKVRADTSAQVQEQGGSPARRQNVPRPVAGHPTSRGRTRVASSLNWARAVESGRILQGCGGYS